jgi:FecR protein
MILSSTGSRFGKSSTSVARRRLSLALSLLGCLMLAGPAHAHAVATSIEDASAPSYADASAGPTRLAQTQPAPLPTPLPAPTPPARPAASPSPLPTPPAPAQSAAPSPTAPSPAATAPAQAPPDEPIGNVATLTGTATVIRNRNSLPLKLQDDIFLNDILQTSSSSTLGVTFNDATTFNLTANARITVDNYIYEDGGKNNSALFDITKGTVAFVAASVAKTGDMKITTPTASLGIRGTTGLVEVPQGGAAAGAHNIKLYPDPDGRVGHIDVSDRNGARLGSLTQGSSGFTIRPGAGGRVTAAPLTISPQQAARDQGIVRQVHAAQVVGRQVVTQQRALRQANPNRNNQPNNPARQPGPQRQNNLQQRPGATPPGSPRQPGSPNRAGQQGQPKQPASATKPGQPGQPPQPASPNRAGQQGQPQQAQPPGLQRQPNVPGARQPGLPNRPAFQPKRPPAPKGKPPKEKKR